MLTEKEMLCCKIGLMQGAVIFGRENRIKATEVLIKQGKKHGYSARRSLALEEELDQMLGDDTLT